MEPTPQSANSFDNSDSQTPSIYSTRQEADQTMVQYVFTPWRDRHELLLVRRQLYPDQLRGATSTATIGQSSAGGQNEGSRADQRRRDQHRAVARVSMWMQRGNCPHMVESTALLTAAMLNDEVAVASENAASSTYAVRAAYSAAFSRYVNCSLQAEEMC